MANKSYTLADITQELGLRSVTIKSWIKHFTDYLGDLSKKKKFSTEDLESFKVIQNLVKVRGFTVEGAKRELANKSDFLEEREKVVKQLTKLRRFLVDLRDSV